jgi:hypothetical protein
LVVVEIRGVYGNNQYRKTRAQPVFGNQLVVVVYRGFSATTTLLKIEKPKTKN